MSSDKNDSEAGDGSFCRPRPHLQHKIKLEIPKVSLRKKGSFFSITVFYVISISTLVLSLKNTFNCAYIERKIYI